jgi:hypothetical protein
MRIAVVGAMTVIACAMGGSTAGDDKGDPPVVLKRADLTALEGVWELKASPKDGWTGTVRATIALYEAGSKATADFGNILYDYDLTKGKDRIRVTNDPTGGVSFAGVRRGKVQALVTSKKFARPAPFKVEPADDLTAPFALASDKLTLDLSKGLQAFLPDTLREMKIVWGKSTWEKVKE